MAEQATLARKEREKLARRGEILRAARKVFAEKGFAAATLEEIADLAELAKGTIYGYFDGKEALFFSLLEEALAQESQILRDVQAEFTTARERLSGMVRRYVLYLCDQRDIFKIIGGQLGGLTGNIREEARERYLETHRQNLAPLVAIMEEGIRAGELRDLDAKGMAYALVGLIHGAMFSLLVVHDSSDAEAIIRAVSEVLLHGIEKQS